MKKNSKKLIASSVIATLAVPVVVVAAEEAPKAVPTSKDVHFTDVQEGAYYYEAVMSLASRGIIDGYGNGLYGPNDKVTRGQAAKIIAHTLNLETQNIVNPAFNDVSSSHMFYKEIAALKSANIITGYPDDNTFRPDQTITRDEMAIILKRAFNLSDNNSASIPFTDTNDYMKPFVAAIYAAGITAGIDEKTFGGSNTVTRGQAATFIYRGELYEAAHGKSVTGDITEVEDGRVKVGNTYYKVGKFSNILHLDNQVALKGANLKAKIKNDEIFEIESLQVNAVGAKDAPVSLTNHVEPVASLGDIPANNVLDFKLIVNSPFVKVINLSFDSVVLSNKVESFQFDGVAKSFEISENVKAIITGNATITQLIVKSKDEIALNINGKIEEISFKVAKALMKLADTVKVVALQYDNNSKPTDFITNYANILTNIEKVNGDKPSNNQPPAIGGGSSSSDSGGSDSGNDSQPSIEEISGIIQETSKTSVTIGAKNYTVDEQLQSLFENDSLKTAQISVKVENGEIVEVTSLTINNDTNLNVTGVTIKGNVTIAAQNVTLKGLVVNGNVIVNEDVEGSLVFTDTHINGKVETAAVNKLARVKSILTNPNMRMASLDFAPLAEVLTTKLRITFNNSTVIEIEIKKEVSELNLKGSSVITSVVLKANTNVHADAQVVLPNLTVSEGVTNVELNATIKNIEISTTDNLVLSGKGNIDNLEVKTEKPVEIKTEGTINNIAVAVKEDGSTAQPSISLGEKVSVGEVKNLEGETIDPKKVVSDYDSVKNQIDKDNIKPIEYIAAKLLPVQGKYGISTLEVVNANNRTIKYRQTASNTPLVAVGEKVPDDAIEYTVGSTFVAWYVKNVEVYVVDENNKILDAFAIKAANSRTNNADLKVEDGNIVIRTNFDQSFNFQGVFIADETSFFYVDNPSDYEWVNDSNGVPTLTIPAQDLKIDFNQGNITSMKFYSESARWGLTSSFYNTGNINQDITKINILKNLSAKYLMYGNNEQFFAQQLNYYKEGFFGKNPDISSIAAYFAEPISKTTASTKEEFEKLLDDTLQLYNAEFAKYSPIKSQIESVYEFRFKTIKGDVTYEELMKLKAEYDQLNEVFKKDKEVEQKLAEVVRAAEDLKKIETLIETYKTLTDRAEKLTTGNQITLLIQQFTKEFDEQQIQVISHYNYKISNFYLDGILDLERISPLNIMNLVKDVNSNYSDVAVLNEKVEKGIDELYEDNKFSPSGKLKNIDLDSLVTLQEDLEDLTSKTNSEYTHTLNSKLSSTVSVYFDGIERPEVVDSITVDLNTNNIVLTFTEAIELDEIPGFEILGYLKGIEGYSATFDLNEAKKQLVIKVDQSLGKLELPRTINLTGVEINGVAVEIKNIPIADYKKQ